MTTTANGRRRRGRPWRGVFALVGVLTLVAAACGDDDGDGDTETGGDGGDEVVESDLVLGAPADCEDNPFRIPGLRDVYGVDLSGGFTSLTTEVVPASLEAGEIDVGVLFTTDAALSDENLVALEDDQGMMAADNVFPLASQELADAYGDDLTGVLDGISGELTTDELIELNSRFVNDREDADAIAADWLADKGLDSGGASPADGPAISIGAQDFPESTVLSEIYKQALEANGFQASIQNVGGFRDLLFGAFDGGDVNLAPEYLGAELNFLEEGAATSDAEETRSALEPLLEERGLVAFDYAEDAVNSNVFVVTRQTSEDLGLTTLSDLADA